MADVQIDMNSIFRDNVSYLNSDNWATYFKKTLKDGFLVSNPAFLYNNVIRFKNHTALLQGQLIDGSLLQDIPVVTAEEGDQIIYYYWNGSKVVFYKRTFVGTEPIPLKYILANLLRYCYGNGCDTQALPSTAGYFIPICYGVYDNGNVKYWNLAKMIHPDGEPLTEHIDMSGSGTIEDVKFGISTQYGLTQIIGGQNYIVNIHDDYTQNQVYLYPVPCINQQPSVIYIVNNTENPISVKIPTEYNWMEFEYVHSGDWVEETGYISYSLLPGVPVSITMTQVAQDVELDYPKSFYEVTQNMKDYDSGEGYTKAEANAIFATQANVETALAGKVDTADLGDLATKDNVDYETDITNLPDFGTLATEDDVDSDDKVYGRKNGEWYDLDGKYVTQSDLDEMTDTNVIADEYDSSETYTVGDVVMHEGVLYKDTEDWTVLDTTKITASGSIGSGKYLYYTNPYGLYVSTQAFSWSQSSASDAVQWMLDTNKVAQVSYIGLQYDRFKTDYTAGQIILVDWDTFVSLNSTTSKFSPVTVEELVDEKIGADSPAFTGTPTAPTPVTGDNSTKLATTAFVGTAIDNAIDNISLDEKLDFTNVASEYDSSATYTAGDLVIDEGQLKQYRYDLTDLQAIPIPSRTTTLDIGTYLYYNSELFYVNSNVFVTTSSQEETYQFFLANPSIFEKKDYELLNQDKVYDEGSIVFTDNKYWETEVTLSFIPVSVEDLLDTKLSISTFLNAFGQTNADISSIDTAIEEINNAIALKAPLESPALTGIPTAPTPLPDDNSTRLATTAFVQSAISGPRSESEYIFYVNRNTGSDDNAGTSTAPFATIQKAVNSIPYGGYGTVYVYTGSYYPVTVSGKTIKFITNTGVVNFWNNNGGGSSHALNVINGGSVLLNGDFEIWSMYGSSVYVSEDSSLFYDNYNSADTLKCTLYISSTATIKSIVDIYGKFISVGKVYLKIDSEEGLDPTNTTGIEAINGGYVNVGDIEVNSHFVNASVFGSNTGSLIVYQSVIGQYGTLHAVIGLGSEPRGFLIASGEYYNKAEVNTLLSEKANTTDMTLKANLASPTFTGTPKAPTAPNGTSTTQLATTAFVQNTLASNGLLAPSDIYVDGTNGNDSTGTGAQSSPFKTIQKAVNSGLATAPVTIRIAPGSYNESVTINGKNIILQGTSNTEIRVTGQGIYPAFTVNNGGKLRLRGVFTLRANGNIGLSIQNNSSVIYERVDSSDVLAVNPLSTSSADKGIILENNSQFTAENKVTVTIPNSGNTSYAVYSENGGHISIGVLNVSMPTGSNGGVVLYATRTTALIGSVTGTYQTELSQTNSIVKVGNTIR